jgi:hypothetical protein
MQRTRTSAAACSSMIQRHYGGGHITEAELEAGFRHWLPNKSAACENRLSQFFTQWFDTAYPSGDGTNKPAITGPGLAGAGFYDASGGCPAYRAGLRKTGGG